MKTHINLAVEEIAGVENGHVVAFAGDLDATNVDDVVDKIFNLLHDGAREIIADFKELRYVNSTGLGILLHFSKQAKERSGSFKICHVNSNVSEIIDLIGASSLLDIYETRDAAVAACK